MNDILSIKLMTGEEIIGQKLGEDKESITLVKPIQLVVSEKGLGFAPVCISIDDASSFTFKKSHILFQANTRKELVDQYIKATTGIQLATSIK